MQPGSHAFMNKQSKGQSLFKFAHSFKEFMQLKPNSNFTKKQVFDEYLRSDSAISNDTLSVFYSINSYQIYRNSLIKNVYLQIKVTKAKTDAGMFIGVSKYKNGKELPYNDPGVSFILFYFIFFLCYV